MDLGARIEIVKILSRLKKLNKREKYIIYGAIGVVGLLIIVEFIVTPFFERKDRMQRALHDKIANLEEMQRWRFEYEALTKNAQVSESRFARRQKGFTLFSFLDQLAGQAGIKDRISYMKPSKITQKNSAYRISRVEMKLNAITLEQLVTYLHGVETSENMVDIKKLSITKKDNNQELLTVVMQVETVEI
jgi:general secretion pathway protein M